MSATRFSAPEPTTTALYPAKQADWQMLKLWAQQGVICLKYLDESVCCPQSPTDYSCGKRGEQKRIRQRQRRGRRMNILGIWQPQVQFD
ncbi:MAG: hypothetical protein KME19_08175 [Microcoleus vaginatus WJT46-NPBG5]|nr:hypothetical protein [Microcoleus vaginatus WJT46-NPBG5]